MKYDECEYCGGAVNEKKVRVSRRMGEKPVVVEDVPAGVCGECGERYFDATVLKKVEIIAKGKRNSKKEITVPVKQYSEAAS